MQQVVLPSKTSLGARAAPLLDMDVGTSSSQRRSPPYLVFAQESSEGSGATSIFVCNATTGQRVSTYPKALTPSATSSGKSRVKIATDSQIGVAVQDSNLVWFGVSRSFVSRSPISNVPWTSVDRVFNGGNGVVVTSGAQIYFLDTPSTRDHISAPLNIVAQHSLSGAALALGSVSDTTFIATDKKLEVYNGTKAGGSVALQGTKAVAVDGCVTDKKSNSIRATVLFADGAWATYSVQGGKISQIGFQAGDNAQNAACAMLQDCGGICNGSLAATPAGFVAMGHSNTAKKTFVEVWTLSFDGAGNCSASREVQVESLGDEAQPMPRILKGASHVTVYQHTLNEVGAAVFLYPVPVAEECEVALSAAVLDSEVKDLANRRSDAEAAIMNVEKDTAELVARLADGSATGDQLLGSITGLTNKVIALVSVASAMGEKQRQVAEDQPALEGSTVADQMQESINSLYVKLHALKLLAACGQFQPNWYESVKKGQVQHRENARRFAALFKEQFGHVLQSSTVETACFPSSTGSSCVQLILDQLGYHAGSKPSIASLLDKLAKSTEKAKSLSLVAVLLLFLAPGATSQAQTTFLVACDLPVALTYWGRLLYVADLEVVDSKQQGNNKSSHSFPRALPHLPHGLSGALFNQAFEHLVHSLHFATAEQLGSQIVEGSSEITPRAAVRLCFLAHYRRQVSTLEGVFLLVPPSDWQLKAVVLAMMVEYGVATNHIDFIERVSLDDATTDLVVDLMKQRPMVGCGGTKLGNQEAQFCCLKLMVQFLCKKRRHRHALTECEELQRICDPSQAQQTLAVASTLRSLIKVCPDEVDVQGLSSAPVSAIAEASASTAEAEAQPQQKGAGGGNSGGAQYSMAVLLQQQQQAAAAANTGAQHQLSGGVSRWPPYSTPQRGMGQGATQSSSFGAPAGSGAGAAFGM